MSRAPLPFGLGREPECDEQRCLQPDVPLPLGTPLADQVSSALSVSVDILSHSLERTDPLRRMRQIMQANTRA